ncbi:MAG TPA: hypothetical protein VKS44_08555 [Candidatus Acidoferrales bacterium]|nr:hypothetical protein [Candidatus Acidoferrales bacterium]
MPTKKRPGSFKNSPAEQILQVMWTQQSNTRDGKWTVDELRNCIPTINGTTMKDGVAELEQNRFIEKIPRGLLAEGYRLTDEGKKYGDDSGWKKVARPLAEGSLLADASKKDAGKK